MTASPIVEPVRGRARSAWRVWVPLGLIFLLGAALRFWALDRPGIWGDEGATYGRVNGTQGELLDRLKFDGFMPLHYQLYWLIARVTALTPAMMRAWPALAGTLTVPAIYFLARQLVTRRVALVATLLAATSAYLLYYSRDAKMYAGVWLFTTLSMGCLFWWLRTGKRIGYWCWMFCSLAAVGIHAPALLALAIQPVLFLAHRGKSWGRATALVLGLGVVGIAPAGYYSIYNDWVASAEKNWNASMLGWVRDYNAQRDLPRLLRYTATAYASAWEWPDKPSFRQAINPVLLTRLEWAMTLLGGVLLAGALPWRKLWLKVRYAGKRRDKAPLPPPVGPITLPRLVFILGAWIILPAYAIYVISFDSPAAPWWGIQSLRADGWTAGWTAGCTWTAAVLGWGALGAALSIRRPRDLVWLAIGAAVIFGLCCGIYAGIMYKRWHPAAFHNWELSWRPWQHVDFSPWRKPELGKMLWMPRYLGVIFPAVLIVAAALLCRLPVGVRHIAIAGLVLLNVGNHIAKVHLDPEPPMGRMVADLWADSRVAKGLDPTPDAPLVFMQAGRWGQGFEPGTGNLSGPVGRYYLAVLANEPVEVTAFRTSPWFITSRLIQRTNLRANAVRQELARRPGAREILYWAYSDWNATPTDAPLRAALGRDWTLAGSETFRAYDHWTWAHLDNYQRFVFRRSEASDPAPAASKPAAKPAARPPTRPASRPATGPRQR